MPDAVMRYLLILFHVDAIWLCEDLLTALPADLLLAAELSGRALQLVHLDEARLWVVVERLRLLLLLGGLLVLV